MPERRPRADALRNRERVLDVAREAFATDGPAVSLDEIARRAGLGPGTVHRHFPTKQQLLGAVIADRLAVLAEAAEQDADADDPGEAFFAFLHRLISTARGHLALTSTFTGEGEMPAGLDEVARQLSEGLGLLLERAQRSGEVRGDIGVTELHALISGALIAERRLPDESSRDRTLRVIVDGLRKTTP